MKAKVAGSFSSPIFEKYLRRGVSTRNAKYEHALIECCDIARTSRVSLARANRVICIIELDIIKRKRRFPALKIVAKLFRVIERNRPLSLPPTPYPTFVTLTTGKKEKKNNEISSGTCPKLSTFLIHNATRITVWPSGYIIKFRGS